MAEITITVRLPFNGDELEVELPMTATGEQIIDELIKGEMLPKVDQAGDVYIYKLVVKRTSDELKLHKTLGDAGIRSEDTLVVAPKVKAGA